MAYRGKPAIPKGAHLRYFHLLDEAEKGRSVRRLVRGGHTHQRVADLTGLTLAQIREHLAAKLTLTDE
jgi:hypothetical protein